MNITKLTSFFLQHIVFAVIVMGGDSIVPHDKAYFTHTIEDDDVEIIYTKDNINFAQQAANIEKPLHKDYENFFNWELDETLYVGLISDHNQIANGFSTQLPNNRQINYVGGTLSVDYFTSKSWLNTLLFHETAHNYQLNAKDNVVSQSFHTLFGNGFFLLPITLPNSFENPFMLEGNAVLNESWHGNGGRLYSGRFKAQTALAAQAGKLKPAYEYNTRLAFPYRESYYIHGGFYNLYLAKKYGLERVNSYFIYHSQDFFWPFLTNASMKEAVGSDFEESLKDFENEQKELATHIVKASGKQIASSQYFYSLGNSKDEIFFITNESGVRAPELVVMNKETKELTKDRDSWLPGKVLKINKEYFTQGSSKISPLRISQALYDSDRFVKKGTESKMLQGYLSSGKKVYFDVASSYSEPQLFVGSAFYAVVNSSVIIDTKDNLYYFKQEKGIRTLYKNKTPLLSYKGFYGIVSDVDVEGTVYFVANSEFGSTLYSYKNGKITRASRADNIVESRLINDKELLVAAISDKDYYYVITPVENIDEKPFATKLFFEDKEYYGGYEKHLDFNVTDLNLNDNYYSFLDMHYSGIDASIGFTAESNLIGNLTLNFEDPLTQNVASLYVTKDSTNVTLTGAGYSNSQYLLNYQLIAYGVVDDNGRDDVRDSGIIVSATLPFYEASNYYGALKTSYFQDYDTKNREPLSASVILNNSEYYGNSMYANFLHTLELYGVTERSDIIAGGSYEFKHDLPSEFYVGLKAKYSKTDAPSGLESRGVKLSPFIYESDMDPSTIDIPSIIESLYASEAAYLECNIAKVINFSQYFFTFPFSLQRESLYAKYRHYQIKDFTSVIYPMNEITAGVTLSTVVFNSSEFPISIEYIYNDGIGIVERTKFQLLLGANF